MEQKTYFQIKPKYTVEECGYGGEYFSNPRCQFNGYAFNITDIYYIDGVYQVSSTSYSFKCYGDQQEEYEFTFPKKRDALIARNEFIKHWVGGIT